MRQTCYFYILLSALGSSETSRARASGSISFEIFPAFEAVKGLLDRVKAPIRKTVDRLPDYVHADNPVGGPVDPERCPLAPTPRIRKRKSSMNSSTGEPVPRALSF